MYGCLPCCKTHPREVRDKRERQRKGRTAETGTANPLISNGFTPALKQALFTLQRSLVCITKKPCLQCK